MAELLIELFSEDIPARMQVNAAEQLKKLIEKMCQEQNLAFETISCFSTPRRIGVVVDGLPAKQDDIVEESKGPNVNAPEQALQGFMRGNGLDNLDACEQRETPKGTFYFVVKNIKGRPTIDVLTEKLPEIMRNIAWPKSMKWADTSMRWVRPFRNILALFDGQTVPATLDVGGDVVSQLTANDQTFGHRFMSDAQAITVTGFADYQEKLAKAFVLINRDDRKTRILEGVAKAEADLGLTLAQDPALVEEVVGLNEWPVVLVGTFDEAFLAVPDECLISSMREHQKYLSLLNKDGTLSNKFIVVSNMETTDEGAAVINGNERVLRARLADAQFFWEQDLKDKLEIRLPALAKVTFHAKLGTVMEKTLRMQAIAGHVASTLGYDVAAAERAAELAKADLTSGMVSEFSDLQGLMGSYYAREDGEADEIANAIADHYKPAGPSDACPNAPISIAAALADKVDTLVGFFAINEKPTGSKDPYALRRAALGIIRLVLENDLRLNLSDLFTKAYGLYQVSDLRSEKDVLDDLMAFFADRLKVVLRDKGVRHDLVDAIFSAHQDDDLTRLVSRVSALQDFLATEDGADLLAAYKRASNIVRIETKKDGNDYIGAVANDLLQADEESNLYNGLSQAREDISPALNDEDFAKAMAIMAALREPVDAFFDKVIVNDDVAEIRANRLKLLSMMSGTLNQVADFSKIEG